MKLSNTGTAKKSFSNPSEEEKTKTKSDITKIIRKVVSVSRTTCKFLPVMEHSNGIWGK